MYTKAGNLKRTRTNSRKSKHESLGSSSGDIVELFPLRHASDSVIVESLRSKDVFEEVPAGSLAILVKKRKDDAIVMTSSGFLGWVYDDEWQRAKV